MLLSTLVVLTLIGLGFAYIGALKDDPRWLFPAGGFWLVIGLALVFSGQLLVQSGEVHRNTVDVNVTLADGSEFEDMNVDEFRQKTFINAAPQAPFDAASALGIVYLIAAVGAMMIGAHMPRRRER